MKNTCTILKHLRNADPHVSDHEIALSTGCSVESVPGCLALLEAANFITITRKIEVSQ